jgi:ribosomal protein S18 acetylase RimI-like enzyme
MGGELDHGVQALPLSAGEETSPAIARAGGPEPIVLEWATRDDWPEIWRFLEPVLRAGATLALPVEWDRRQARAYWFAPPHRVRIAKVGGRIAGTYYLKANQPGHGNHVANCGYVTDPDLSGLGVGTAMCLDSLARAREAGFQAMQYNLVVETNQRAIRRWTALGFSRLARIPAAFRHPVHGPVAALVMWRDLHDIDGAARTVPGPNPPGAGGLGWE